MKILLIVSPYRFSHSKASKAELLGVLYLAAALRSKNHEVLIYDPTIGNPVKLNEHYYYGVPDQEIEKKIRSFTPDVIGISCHYAYSREETYKVASLAKKIDPNIITVIGGLVATIYNKKVLDECDFLDYGLIGESERSFPDLLSYLSCKSPDPESIDGLIYRKDNEVLVNKKCNFIENLDEIPYPARDLVNVNQYMNTGEFMYGLGGRPTLSLLTSRSCPNQCTFCNMWLVHGKRWRARTPDNVLGEIDEMINKYKAEHIYIMDDNFVFNPERAKKICEGIIKKGYNFKWNTPNGISVKGIDEELALLMKKAGCANVCIAIESGSEYIRNTVIKKRTTNEQIVQTVKYFNKAKIPVGGFMLLGMPGENDHHFNESVNFVKKLSLSFIVASFAVPYPGTKLYSDLIAQGIIKADFAAKKDDLSLPVFETEDFTKAELIARKKKLIISFYLNHIPGIFVELISGRLNWTSSPKQLYDNTLKPVFFSKQ